MEVAVEGLLGVSEADVLMQHKLQNQKPGKHHPIRSCPNNCYFSNQCNNPYGLLSAPFPSLNSLHLTNPNASQLPFSKPTQLRAPEIPRDPPLLPPHPQNTIQNFLHLLPAQTQRKNARKSPSQIPNLAQDSSKFPRQYGIAPSKFSSLPTSDRPNSPLNIFIPPSPPQKTKTQKLKHRPSQ